MLALTALLFKSSDAIYTQGGLNGGGGRGMNRAAMEPKADLLFKYGTVPACSMFDGRFMQVLFVFL